MKIKAILAHDSLYGIGKNKGLPWAYNKDDMEWFKQVTTGHVVVMGRKTWESIGSKKLKNRINCVITHNSEKINGTPDKIITSLEDIIILDKQYHDKIIWIIGGGALYEQTIPLFCDKLYVTKMNKAYDCDTFINSFFFKWYKEKQIVETDECTFSIWSRI